MSKHYSRKTKGRSKDKKGITKKLGTIFDNAQKAVDDFFEEERHRKRIKKASKMLDFLLLLALFAIIYCMASIFTPWTGAVGEAINKFMTGKWGLASLIPLPFLGYLSVALLVKREIPAFLEQLAGMILFFLAAELLLGLIFINNPRSANIHLCGTWGLFIATISLKSVGPLGVSLFGLTLGFFVYFLYGTGNFREFVAAFRKLLSNVHGKIKDLFRPLSMQKKAPSEPEYREREIKLSDLSKLPESEFYNTDAKKGLALESAFDKRPYRGEKEAYALFEADDSEDGFVLPLDFEPGKFPPPLEILGVRTDHDTTADIKPTLEKYGAKIIETLAEFDIESELADIVLGPTVIQFRIQIAPGIKVSRIAALSNDLALALAVPSLRVEAPILGQPYVGIEIPNPKRRPVLLRDVIASSDFMQSKYELPLPLGLKVDGTPMVVGLENLPHLLVAGTTGSGKSVFVSSCLIGLCFVRRPDEVKFLLVDPKRVEMTLFEKLPHILTPPIVETKEAVAALAWATSEMERRYEVFAKTRVRNIKSYNEKVLPKDRLYNLVIIVDELADLMMTSPREVEDYICRLAQMARATGIHLILATQRPSVNVVTGLIKANFPARVAFTLPSQADSRTILDVGGAEKLLGRGDMLFLSPKFAKPVRIQAPWVEEEAVIRFIKYTINIFGEPEYINISEGEQASYEAIYLDDPLLEEAVEVVLATGIASASRLQRQLRVGFTRAARLIDTMEQLGIVGPQEGSKPRDILLDEDRAREVLSQALSGDRNGINRG